MGRFTQISNCIKKHYQKLSPFSLVRKRGLLFQSNLYLNTVEVPLIFFFRFGFFGSGKPHQGIHGLRQGGVRGDWGVHGERWFKCVYN
jgi:hypothetical protein